MKNRSVSYLIIVLLIGLIIAATSQTVFAVCGSNTCCNSFNLSPQSFPFSGGAGTFDYSGCGSKFDFSPSIPYHYTCLRDSSTGSCAKWVTHTVGIFPQPDIWSDITYTGTLFFTVAENLCNFPRSAYGPDTDLGVITQDAATQLKAIWGMISPTSLNVGSYGGALSVSVGVNSLIMSEQAFNDLLILCNGPNQWKVTSNAPWIKITGDPTISPHVSFTVDPNTGAKRTGSLSVAGWPVTVVQDAATTQPTDCAVVLDPQTYSMHIPLVQYQRTLFTNDIIYVSLDMAIVNVGTTAHFKVTNYQVLSNVTPSAGCPPATMSPILNLYLPTFSFNNAKYWLTLKNIESENGDILFDISNFGLK